MNINELLVSKSKSNQRPSGLKSDNKDQLKLSDFLQYPTLHNPDPEPGTDNIELRQLTGPNLNPKASEVVDRLVEATGALEVLEVLHEVYKMYVEGDLVDDIQADQWPDFWDEILQ